MEHSSWHALIKEQLPEGYFGKINQFMNQVYAQGTVYPPKGFSDSLDYTV